MTKAVALAALVILTASAQKKPDVVSQTVWSPKATKLPGWTGPHKPHTKLAEVLAAHKGQANWSHLVVDDEHLNAQYIQMAPGASTRRRMHPDTREWWVIQSGQIRFTIDGQEPFVAKKGYLVQVPYRTFYKMETVGTEPSLRFEVNIAKAKTQYPSDEKPPDVPGYEFLKTAVGGQADTKAATAPSSISPTSSTAPNPSAASSPTTAPCRTSSSATSPNSRPPRKPIKATSIPNAPNSGSFSWEPSNTRWKVPA